MEDHVRIKRNRKIKEQAETYPLDSDEGNTSANTTSEGQEHIVPTSKADDAKAKELRFKYDNVDKIREQQSARYEKIKGELALKRLMNTVFSDKCTDDQRLELLKDLQTKLNKN